MAQEWLQRNLLALISAENWPSRSPDLNPLYCKLWAVLKDMACRKHHNNLESLQRSLVNIFIYQAFAITHVTGNCWWTFCNVKRWHKVWLVYGIERAEQSTLII